MVDHRQLAVVQMLVVPYLLDHVVDPYDVEDPLVNAYQLVHYHSLEVVLD